MNKLFNKKYIVKKTKCEITTCSSKDWKKGWVTRDTIRLFLVRKLSWKLTSEGSKAENDQLQKIWIFKEYSSKMQSKQFNVIMIHLTLLL